MHYAARFVVLKAYFRGNECCAVHAGDTLGLVNANAVVSQFAVDDQARISTSGAQNVVVGDQLTFDSLVLPYRFSLAAAYDTGQHCRYSSRTLLYTAVYWSQAGFCGNHRKTMVIE